MFKALKAFIKEEVGNMCKILNIANPIEQWKSLETAVAESSEPVAESSEPSHNEKLVQEILNQEKEEANG